jgi:hypothetical protein
MTLLPYEQLLLVIVVALIVGNLFANYYGFGVIMLYAWIKRNSRRN